jgi:hypothetical protein
MKLTDFIDYHSPALQRDPARHNVLLGRIAAEPAPGLRRWSLGAPGQMCGPDAGAPDHVG